MIVGHSCDLITAHKCIIFHVHCCHKRCISYINFIIYRTKRFYRLFCRVTLLLKTYMRWSESQFYNSNKSLSVLHPQQICFVLKKLCTQSTQYESISWKMTQQKVLCIEKCSRIVEHLYQSALPRVLLNEIDTSVTARFRQTSTISSD